MKNKKFTGLEMTNCVFIGLNAGSNIISGHQKIIIGDNITSLDPLQENAIFLGENVAIGKTVFGKPCNLYDILKEYKEQLNIKTK